MIERTQLLTLGEAARQLRMSRKTLDKWLERLSIVPQRHEWDYRFYTITDEEMQHIREARRQMPGQQKTPIIPSYNLPAFDRQSTDGMPIRDVLPTVTPMPRLRPLQRDTFRAVSGDLPEGMMSRTDAADLHSFPRSTLRRWCDEGRIETASETYGGEHGQFATARPVTARGLRQFYALASKRADFAPCLSCPHKAPEEPLAAGDDAPVTPAAEG